MTERQGYAVLFLLATILVVLSAGLGVLLGISDYVK